MIASCYLHAIEFLYKSVFISSILIQSENKRILTIFLRNKKKFFFFFNHLIIYISVLALYKSTPIYVTAQDERNHNIAILLFRYSIVLKMRTIILKVNTMNLLRKKI